MLCCSARLGIRIMMLYWLIIIAASLYVFTFYWPFTISLLVSYGGPLLAGGMMVCSNDATDKRLLFYNTFLFSFVVGTILTALSEYSMAVHSDDFEEWMVKHHFKSESITAQLVELYLGLCIISMWRIYLLTVFRAYWKMAKTEDDLKLQQATDINHIRKEVVLHPGLIFN